jgi:hypothetical protein
MAPSCLADDTHDSALSNLEKWFCNALAREAWPRSSGEPGLGAGGGWVSGILVSTPSPLVHVYCELCVEVRI